MRALPFADHAVDGSVAAFVLNHLTDPHAGFAELVRVTRSGGVVLASVYSNQSRSATRDRVDGLACEAGWEAPTWYLEAKATTTTLLGSAAAMTEAACAAGLVDVVVDERPVDVGVDEPRQLVDYRLGHAAFAAWLDRIGEPAAEKFRRRAVAAIGTTMEPYRPVVVFAAGRVGHSGR